MKLWRLSVNNKMLFIVWLIILSFSLSGCGSRRELETLGVVDILIYDINQDDTRVIIAEIINPSGAGEGGRGEANKPLIIKSE